jgi:hypothetical protein
MKASGSFLKKRTKKLLILGLAGGTAAASRTHRSIALSGAYSL